MSKLLSHSGVKILASWFFVLCYVALSWVFFACYHCFPGGGIPFNERLLLVIVLSQMIIVLVLPFIFSCSISCLSQQQVNFPLPYLCVACSSYFPSSSHPILSVNSQLFVPCATLPISPTSLILPSFLLFHKEKKGFRGQNLAPLLYYLWFCPFPVPHQYVLIPYFLFPTHPVIPPDLPLVIHPFLSPSIHASLPPSLQSTWKSLFLNLQKSNSLGRTKYDEW